MEETIEARRPVGRPPGKTIESRREEGPQPQGAYYALRRTESGLWSIDSVEFKPGERPKYNPAVTAPDLQNMAFMKLIRIFEKRYTR